MNLLQRRKAGLTVVNVLAVLRKRDKQELENSEAPQLAVEVLAELVAGNPQGWQDIDWDKALVWLEKLLELILKFLPLFLAFV